jgi:transcriptional regulator with XRE-family HTH domain
LVQAGFLVIKAKIKQDTICIGSNIRSIRKSKGIGQTELVELLQLKEISIARETLAKIERGIQHIYAEQLRGIKEVLETSYDEFYGNRSNVQSGLLLPAVQGNPCHHSDPE